MKVQRYNYGASNVQQRQAGRAALRTPGEVAAEAYAPYQAVSDVSGAITQGLQAEDQRRRKIQNEEDAIEAKLLGVKLKSGVAQTLSDPKYDNRMQADGKTPSASAMLEDYETLAGDITTGLENIKDPKTRANTERLLQVAIDEGRLAVRNEANNKSDAWNAQAQFDLRTIAFQAEDWDFYREVNNGLLDAGKQTQAQYAQAEKAATIRQKQIKVDETLNSYDQKIASGMGEEVLADQLANPDSDDDVQDAIVAGIKAQMSNYDKAKSKQEAVVKGQMIREFGAIKRAIEQNQPVDADAVANWYATAAELDPEWAATKESELLNAQLKGLGIANNVSEAAMRLQNGVPLMNTKTEREGLDGVINLSIPAGANEQDALDISVGIQKQAQIPSESSWRLMSAGGRDVNSTVIGAEMYMALVDPNDLHQMDLGLKEGKEMLYSQISLMTANGSMSTQDAAEIMQERYTLETKNPDKYDAVTNIWQVDGTGVDSATEAFNDMLDTYYDKIPIVGFSGVEGAQSIKDDIVSSDVDTQSNYFRYQRYYKNAWYLTAGDPAGAKELADTMYQRSTPLTNINGKWQAQYQGIAGDAETLATEWKTKFADKRYLARNENGLHQPFTIDQLSDDVTFENPVKTPDGQTQYKLFYKGEQLAPWDTGMKVSEAAEVGATATFDKTDVARMSRSNDPLKKKIIELEAQSELIKSQGQKSGITSSEIKRTEEALSAQYPDL
jgi:hypothetical protein